MLMNLLSHKQMCQFGYEDFIKIDDKFFFFTMTFQNQ